MTDEEELRQILKEIPIDKIRELAKLDKEIPIDKIRQLAKLDKAINEACDEYHGSFQGLSSAIGALVAGQIYGWHVIRIAISTGTCIKYERVLGIKFAQFCPERGRLAYRSWGLKLADTVSDFWGAVNGRVPGKRSDQILPKS
ncbi:MAG TPA: hypothetical protein V6D12_06675 [Candidatus Obscuribacterales bacterium]